MLFVVLNDSLGNLLPVNVAVSLVGIGYVVDAINLKHVREAVTVWHGAPLSSLISLTMAI